MTKINQASILAFFKQEKGAFLVSELFDIFGLSGTKAYHDFVKTLAELERLGKLVITPDGRFKQGRRPDDQVLKGIFRRNRRGFGFVKVLLEEEREYYISQEDTLNALDGDEVYIQPHEPKSLKGSRQVANLSKSNPEAKIIKISNRHLRQFVGRIARFGQDLCVIPDTPGLKSLTCLIEPQGLAPIENQVAIVEITQYADEAHHRPLKGIITTYLGDHQAPGVDILTVLSHHAIKTDFPQEVLSQAQAYPDCISAEQLAGRTDLRHLLTFTIDGADAKDLDDAISLELLKDGQYCLYVHIADVSHFVTPNSPLDQEAFLRGTSVYVTDRVVPMLPKRLSNGLCSLHPGVDRLTLTCQMKISSDGHVMQATWCESVIRSDARLTYDQVNAFYQDEASADPIRHEGHLAEVLGHMKKLHRILEKKRAKRGAINFDTTEARIKLDAKGHPVAIIKRSRGVAERLIESFMLQANEAIARMAMQHRWPFIYRVHEAPKAEKLDQFIEYTASFGLQLQGRPEFWQPKDLQKILTKIKGEPYETVVSTVLLRSMQQARYSQEPLGHFGLATEEYTHFTSPIRRYPDLIVHRLLKTYAKGQAMTMDLAAVADQSSKMERVAIEAEREVDAMKKAEFMLDKIGEQFEATVSSVTNFGVFVALDNTVEGIIPLRTMTNDFYHFIASHHLLIGERTGHRIAIGDRVKVTLVRVDVSERQIDFALLADKKQGKASRRKSNRRGQPAYLGKKKSGNKHQRSRQSFKKVSQDKSRKKQGNRRNKKRRRR